MRRRIPLLIVLGALLAALVPATPARAAVSAGTSQAKLAALADAGFAGVLHDSSGLYRCTGYHAVVWHQTGAGNVYEDRRNLCLGFYGWASTSPIRPIWEGVVRNQCYRNGSPYGDGTGGCRWDSNVGLQSYNVNDVCCGTDVTTAWCYTCGGTYVQDSGRRYSGHVSYPNTSDVRVRARAGAGGTRIYFADGSTRLFTQQVSYTTFEPVPQ
jgi:hypothetical protein